MPARSGAWWIAHPERKHPFFNVSAPKSWRPSPGLIRSDKTGSSLMSHYSVVKEPKDKDIPSTIQAEKNAFSGTCFLNFFKLFF